MAQIAKTEADKAASSAKDAGDKVAELGKQTTDKAAGSSRERCPRRLAVCCVRRSMPGPRSAQKTAGRAQAGMAEINQSLLDLLNQQARHNVQVVQTLAQPSNWGKAVAAPERVPARQLAAGNSVCPALCRGQPGRHGIDAVDCAQSGHESVRPTCNGRSRPQQGSAAWSDQRRDTSATSPRQSIDPSRLSATAPGEQQLPTPTRG